MIDETAARELDLYAENESALYNQFKSIIENIKRRIESGKYDASKAPKLWGYWYEAAARRYVKEFGGEVRTQFPAALRAHLSKERAKDEYPRILAGEYGAVTPGAKSAGAKRSRAKRSGAPKRSKSKRATGAKRRSLSRLHRVRVGAGRRGFGILRSGASARTYPQAQRSYKQLLSDLRALYERGNEQGVVDLAMKEIDMFPGFTKDELYRMPAYQASRLVIDDLARRVRWAG